MDKSIVIERLVDSLNELYRNDKVLFTMEVNERTICSQLACYMKKYFVWYKVDCEYNRNMWNPKECWRFSTPYPDILIHQRLDNDNNLVFIETKTKWSNFSKEEKKEDIDKINCFMENAPYEYKYWLFVIFGKDEHKCEFFYKEDGIIRCQSL